MKNLITLLCFSLCLIVANNSFAVVAPSAPLTNAQTELNDQAPKKMTKKQLRQQKKLRKIQKRMKKMQAKGQDVDFSDPVDKWMWFWIFGWGAAIVLSIVASAIVVGTAFTGGFGFGALLFLVAWLAGLFGTVSLIIWLVKKFA